MKTRWAYTIKYNVDGGVAKHKARLVAKGFTQIYGKDYCETFARVSKLSSIHMIISIAANMGHKLFLEYEDLLEYAHMYCRIKGKLIYFTITRPDISQVVSMVSQ